jgi:hypothetical protein
MSASEAVEVPLLRALAGGISVRDPLVRRFVAEALHTVETLNAQLATQSGDRVRSDGDGFLDTGHRNRLDTLILAQQAELDEAGAVLDRLRALMDFSTWAAEEGRVEEPAVLLSDLRRALSPA